MAVTHTHARMLKHKHLPSTPSQNRILLIIICMILVHVKMASATYARCNYNRLGYSKMAHDDVTTNTYSTWNWNTMQLVWCAEPGACKTNVWMHACIALGMLIKICPNTNHWNQVSKKEKEEGVRRHAHTHPHLLHIRPRSEGPKE